MKYTQEELEKLVAVAVDMTNCHPGTEDWEALETALKPFVKEPEYVGLDKIAQDHSLDVKKVCYCFYRPSCTEDLDCRLNPETFNEEIAVDDVNYFVRRMKKTIESDKPFRMPPTDLEPFIKHFRGMEE
ncbi:hypothetical protein UFOVP75_212 [uncultured Caudovirales phage]|uniref:Uncharacterized protein n=1 Tax=uncultured Caudovirales phage TaxID=2100421 RepID=A0A6J5L6E6_9CAUD|nr:hypothetical protein UFOVP75_212 [uncultured Caudovirales phage]